MKKLYFLLFTLITTLSFGQTPIITTIVDGDCAGGNPKLLEIYANGTVDFSLYSLQNQTNANTTWGNSQDLSGLGIVTDDFVYITTSGSADALASDFPSLATANVLISNTMNVNGDDRVRVVLTADDTVIDQYGVESVDGSGEAWEYADSYATRISGTGPDAGFAAANWVFGGAGALDGLGICQNGNETFESLIGGVGVYSTTGSTTPIIAITSPNDGDTLLPGTTSVDLEFSATNLSGSETFDITVNGTVSNNVTSPFSITTTDGATYDVTVEVVDGGTVVVSDMITFSVGSIVTVTDITELRADVTANGLGGFYEITGNSLVTHTDGFRNRKWIQDTNISGVLIYDQDGVITTTYNVGDLVSGLKGFTTESNGVLRFIPTSDSGVIVSSGNTVTPQVVTITDLTTSPNDYESELIELQNVTFVDGDGTATFATGQNYDVTDGTNSIPKRTDFFGADYIGELIPSTELSSLVAIAGQFNGSAQIYVRSMSDFVLSVNKFDISNFSIYPNPTNTGIVTITSTSQDAMNVQVFDILGKQVKNETLTNNTLNVSNLKSGVYIVKITQNNASTTKKLVIK
ncbi:T9SS type A sorting domain-containing protein [Oceanihabitans sediminis]|uniref:T9SS type A sorting domain-containing protein n=2 Tax=Oceanihabitans sediminis TaxID=1812012 RepID=UPI00299E77E3|nr:T9SS type A sorting domain-containing protein [Oceanihabitans sediminis]MDX1773269.1 T9SS type A sorting domain-containing protein [Oceanihabitans sediminis]